MTLLSENTSGNKKRAFSFTGAAGEYFRIWIVNLLLSIVTLGIYTAWAKVRRLRYFYGNSWLDGHNFEYHAKPIQILIGRIIVVVVLVLLNIVSAISPTISLLVLIPYLLALPWLINKALAFNARMTSYRNVRFGFEGSYGSAFWVFICLPLGLPLVVFGIIFAIIALMGLPSAGEADPATLYPIIALVLIGFVGYVLLLPYISKMTNTYIANNTKFGGARFNAEIAMGALYRNLGLALLVGLMLPLVVSILLGFVIGVSAFTGDTGTGAQSALEGLSVFGGLLFYLLALVGYMVYSAGVRNIAFNATTLDGKHQLRSTLSRFRYAWIMVSNLFVSIFSVGLMIPWAAVRKWRYLADQTSIEGPALDDFISEREAEGNVTAAEYLDIDGIDFGL